MGPLELITSVVRVGVLGILWMLDAVEFICLKSTAYIEQRTQKFNLALIFPNGQRHEVVVESTECISSTEPKRIKLLLDIDVLPDKNYQVVSEKNMNCNEKKLQSTLLLSPAWFIQKLSFYTLEVTTFMRRQLMSLKRLNLEAHPFFKSLQQISNGKDTENRKKISPRRRLPKSKVSSLRRFMAKFWKLLGYSKTDGQIVFDKIEGLGDTSLNGSMNNSRMKATEKRKELATSDSDYSLASDEEVEMEEVAKSNKVLSNGTESTSENVNQSTEDTSSTSVEQQEFNIENQYLENAPLLKQNYFEVDDDYKSADDPDFIPSSHNSSSDEISDIDDVTQERLVEEAMEELKMSDEMEIPKTNGSKSEGHEGQTNM